MINIGKLPEGFWIDDRYFRRIEKYDPTSISEDLYFGTGGIYVLHKLTLIQKLRYFARVAERFKRSPYK